MTSQILELSPNVLVGQQQALIELLTDAVDGGASVSFLAPLTHEAAALYWAGVADEVSLGGRVVLAAVVGGWIVGCVHLVLAEQPNGHHRAEIQKLMVHSGYRRQGIGAQLLAAAEATALSHGRWLLVLDAEEGSAAERFYAHRGYQRVGTIPHYAQSSRGDYAATVLFYKQLPVHPSVFLAP